MSSQAFATFRKDLRITRVLWAPMIFSYYVFLLMFMDNVWVYLATGACLAFVAAATALGIDDRYQTEPLFAALPGTRRSLVAGRYLAWGAVTAAGLGLFLAFTALVQHGLGLRTARLASFVSLKGAAAFLVGTVLAGFIYLPFYFRFGFWRGMWLFTAAGFVFSAAGLSVVGRLVPAEAGVLTSASLVPQPFVGIARGLRALARLIDGYLGRPTVVAAFAAGLAVLVYLSFRLSVSFYEKRDL